MTKQPLTLTRHDLEAKIVKRCWENEEFHKEFTADPAGAFVKYLEIPAANLPKIVMHEESAGSWHIVLPAKPENANQLTEQDLEGIAGGSLFNPWIAIATTAAVGVSLAGGSASVVASATITLDSGW